MRGHAMGGKRSEGACQSSGGNVSGEERSEEGIPPKIKIVAANKTVNCSSCKIVATN